MTSFLSLRRKTDQEPRIEQVGPDQLHLSFWVITEVQEERFIILYNLNYAHDEGLGGGMS
jgi:hypothetical protein